MQLFYTSAQPVYAASKVLGMHNYSPVTYAPQIRSGHDPGSKQKLCHAAQMAEGAPLQDVHRKDAHTIRGEYVCG
jgi:hypothetical protein